MDFIFSSFLWLLPLSTIPLIFHLINNRKFKIVQFSSIRFIEFLKTKSMRKKHTDELINQYISKISLKNIANTRDIANLILFMQRLNMKVPQQLKQ